MFVLNLQFQHADGDEMLAYIDERGVAWHGQLLLDAPEGVSLGEWSAPEHALAGDVCVFMFAKSSYSRMRACIQSMCEEHGVSSLADSGSGCTPEQVRAMQTAVLAADRHHGNVVGWARLLSAPVKRETSGGKWGNRVYAEMGEFHACPSGISLLSMEPLVKISRFGGLTPLSADAAMVVGRMVGVDAPNTAVR